MVVAIKIFGRGRTSRSKRKFSETAFPVLAILFILLSATALVGVDEKLPSTIEFSPNTPVSHLPQNPWAFCVTDDEIFMIPDYEAGNIKIYEINGQYLELVNTLGKKGYYGPDKLAKPIYCFYNKDENKFGVMDLGIRKIFIYDRIGRIDFKRVKEIRCWRGATDFQLIGNKLYISGFKMSQSGEYYALYSIDLNDDRTTLLLPSYYKYGFESFDELTKEYYKQHIIEIGIEGWFSAHNDNLYFVWEGDLRIMKLNIISGELMLDDTFGEQSPHYIKPYASKELIKAHQKGDYDTIISEKSKMSYIKNIFTTSDNILVIYEGPADVNMDSSVVTNFRIQFYTLRGDFIKEELLEGQPDPKMWFDIDRKILYSLSNSMIDTTSITAERGSKPYILKYEIQ